MTMAGELILPNFPENLDVCGVPAKGSPELHVLAVDDSHVDRKVIEKLLKRLSCKVTAVDSGLSALQFLGLDGDKSSVGFDDLKINLIMTDYSMPGMTGFELLKKIKESSAFRETPVVIMSSERILARIERCMEEGAKEFLAKPVKLSDVERLMNFVMRGGDVCQGSRINGSKRGLDDDSAGGSNHHHASSTPSLPLSLPHGCDAAASCSPSSSDCSVLLPTSTSLSTAKKVRIQ